MVWFYLAVAIAAEVMATTALKFSEGFTKIMPSALVVVGYAGVFIVYQRSSIKSPFLLLMRFGRVQVLRL